MGYRMGDGFDGYAATADVVKKWAQFESGWTFSPTAGILGGGAIVNTGVASIAKLIPTVTPLLGWTQNGNYGCFHLWLKISAPPAANEYIIGYYNSTGTLDGPIRVDTGGRLFLTDQNAAVKVVGVTNVCDNIFHHVEIKIGTSTNHVSGSGPNACYVDGIVQWDAPYTIGMQTTDQTFLRGFPSRTMTIDDYLVYDSLGTGLMGSAFPIGQQNCLTKWPNADSAVQFTRSTGATNFGCVDETNPDVSDYVESGTSGQQDLYDFPDLGFTPASVRAVVANAYMHNPNVGSISGRIIAKNGATQVDGSTIPLFTVPKIYQQHFDTDPNGAIPWSGSGFDSTKFGVKVP